MSGKNNIFAASNYDAVALDVRRVVFHFTIHVKNKVGQEDGFYLLK